VTVTLQSSPYPSLFDLMFPKFARMGTEMVMPFFESRGAGGCHSALHIKFYISENNLKFSKTELNFM